jgi:hypothetical protein
MNADLIAHAMDTPVQHRVDALLERCKMEPQVVMPLTHEFTPGLYIRTIVMPKGTFVISKFHKTEHPFVITRGKVEVWTEGQGTKMLTAPHRGITKPGTRRMLVMHEETEWTTFHPTTKTDLAEIERDLIYNPETDHD